MGCDIHLFAEVSWPDGGFLALASGKFFIPRDYNLFAALAGVRAEPGFLPLILPRRIPRDASTEASTNYYFPVIHNEQAVAWGVGEHFSPKIAIILKTHLHCLAAVSMH